MENLNDNKNLNPALKFFPLTALVILFGALFYVISMAPEDVEKTSFGSFGFDSKLGIYFGVFIAIVLADFYIVNMFVNQAIKDPKILLLRW